MEYVVSFFSWFIISVGVLSLLLEACLYLKGDPWEEHDHYPLDWSIISKAILVVLAGIGIQLLLV